MAKAHSLREFLFVAPWIIDHTPRQERQTLVAEAPLPVRLVYRLGNRRYLRLASAVNFAACDDTPGWAGQSTAAGGGSAR